MKEPHIVIKFILGRLLPNVVIINDFEIVRENDKVHEKISFNDVNKIAISFFKEKIKYIKIFYTDRDVFILGYDKIDEISRILLEKFKDREIEIKKNKVRIHINHPVLFSVFISIINIFLFIFISKIDEFIPDVFLFSIIFISGLCLLIVKPFSKLVSKRFAKFDKIMGLLFIFLFVAYALIQIMFIVFV